MSLDRMFTMQIDRVTRKRLQAVAMVRDASSAAVVRDLINKEFDQIFTAEDGETRFEISELLQIRETSGV